MKQIIRAEFLKVVYLRSNRALLIVAALFGVLNTLATAFALDSEVSSFGLPDTSTTLGVDAVYANTAASYVFALIVGILLFTGEYKHGTAIATYLSVPKRSSVLIAKIVTGAIIGLVFQLVSFIASFASAYIYLGLKANSGEPSTDKWLNYFAAAALSGIVLGIVGISLGALIKNQAIAVTGSLLWLFIVEGLLTAFLPDVGKFLLTGAITGMLEIEVGPNDFNIDSSNYLTPMPATLLLIGYALIFMLIATQTTLKRDIE